MDKTLKVCIIALAVLVVLCPIGLLAVGTAYGEWGPDDIKDMVGYVPTGLQQLSDLWHPLLPDYDFGEGHDTVPQQAPGYYASAIIGVLLCAGIVYGAGTLIAKKD
jgi:hypothetical protein